MPLLFPTPDGKKVMYETATVENTGTAAADMDVDITINGAHRVLAVLGGYTDANARGINNPRISGNTVTVTALSVAAGATATVTVIVLAV